MSQYAVLSDGIMDKDDNDPFSVSQAVSMETSRAKRSYQSFSQSLPWLIDLCFFKENCFHTLGYESNGS